MRLDSLAIENFRGIAKGTVAGFSPFTVLVGKNNSGKSSVLEAMYLLLAARSNLTSCLTTIASRRGCFGGGSISYLFHNASTSLSVRAASSKGQLEVAVAHSLLDMGYASVLKAWEYDLTKSTVLNVTVSEPGKSGIKQVAVHDDCKVAIPILLQGHTFENEKEQVGLVDHTMLHKFGSIENLISRAEREDAAIVPSTVSLLNETFPDLKDIRILKLGEEYVAHLTTDKSYPFYTFGDGLKLAIPSLLVAASMRNGVLLLEEPENFQHFASARILIRGLLKGAAAGTQIMVSTHSLEFIDEVLASARENSFLDKIGLVHLDLTNGQLTSRSSAGAEAERMRKELEIDLRNA